MADRHPPLIVDAQLLVLYVVGTYDRGLIAQHKRCGEFDEIDFDVLLFQIEQARELILLPHVLAETSNLLRLIGDPTRTRLSEHFARFVQVNRESFIASNRATGHARHGSHGLVDCVMLVGRKDATLLTKDFDLYRAASADGRRVVNFTHLREQIAPRL